MHLSKNSVWGVTYIETHWNVPNGCDAEKTSGYETAEFIELLIFPVQYTSNADIACTSNVCSHITEATTTDQAQIRGI
jgi:hypothetical protein